MRTIGLLTAGLLCVTSQAAVINGDFSAGLTGWTVLGNAMAFGGQLDPGAQPLDVAYLTTSGVDFATWRAAGGKFIGGFGDDWFERTTFEGSIISQTITLDQDAILLFDYRTFGGAATAMNGVVTGGVGVVNGMGWSLSAPGEWGWNAIPLLAGEHTIVAGILNWGSPADEWALAVDNFELVDPHGWWGYGPDGYDSDHPYGGTPQGLRPDGGINGALSVPEPTSALALLPCVALAGLAFRRHRNR